LSLNLAFRIRLILNESGSIKKIFCVPSVIISSVSELVIPQPAVIVFGRSTVFE